MSAMSGKATKKKKQTSFAAVAPQQFMNYVLHSFFLSELTPEPQSVQLQLKMKRKRTTPKKMALKKSTLRLLIYIEKPMSWMLPTTTNTLQDTITKSTKLTYISTKVLHHLLKFLQFLSLHVFHCVSPFHE